MTSDRLGVWAGLATISFIWGSTWIVIKIGLSSVPPFLGVGARFLIASAVLFLILRTRHISIPTDRNAKMLYALLTVLTFTIPFGLVYWSEQFIPSSLSSILFAAFPFWVAIFSEVLLPGESLNSFKMGGIVLGFAGLVVIFSHDINWSDERTLIGMCALLASTVIQAFSTVMVRKYGQPVSPVAMNFVGMSLGGVLLLALGLLTESTDAIVWNLAAIGPILYLALFGSVVAYVTYYWLLKRIEVVYVSLTAFINPVVAVLLGALILDERLAPRIYLGAALVLAGILVANGEYLAAKVSLRKQ